MRKTKNKLRWSIIAFGSVLLLLGIIFELAGVGRSDFLGYHSVGGYLIVVGFIALLLSAFRRLSPARVVDERMEKIAAKAGKVTFLGIIIVAFAVMVLDGISPIFVPYSMFMAYFICGIVILYAASYKLLLRYG